MRWAAHSTFYGTSRRFICSRQWPTVASWWRKRVLYPSQISPRRSSTWSMYPIVMWRVCVSSSMYYKCRSYLLASVTHPFHLLHVGEYRNQKRILSQEHSPATSLPLTTSALSSVLRGGERRGFCSRIPLIMVAHMRPFLSHGTVARPRQCINFETFAWNMGGPTISYFCACRTAIWNAVHHTIFIKNKEEHYIRITGFIDDPC